MHLPAADLTGHQMHYVFDLYFRLCVCAYVRAGGDILYPVCRRLRLLVRIKNVAVIQWHNVSQSRTQYTSNNLARENC